MNIKTEDAYNAARAFTGNGDGSFKVTVVNAANDGGRVATFIDESCKVGWEAGECGEPWISISVERISLMYNFLFSDSMEPVIEESGEERIVVSFSNGNGGRTEMRLTRA